MDNPPTSKLKFTFTTGLIIFLTLLSIGLIAGLIAASAKSKCPKGQSCFTSAPSSSQFSCPSGQTPICVNSNTTSLNPADTAALCNSETLWKTANILYRLTPNKTNLTPNQLCKMTLNIMKKETPNVIESTNSGFVSSSNNILEMGFGNSTDSAILYPDGRLRWNSGTYWER